MRSLSLPLFLRGATLLGLLLAAAADPASADEVCALAVTPTECVDSLRAELDEARAAAVGPAIASAQERIEAAPTSVDAFGSEIASTLKDFLPLLDGLVGIDSISDDGREVNLNLNPGLAYRPLQLTARIRKPEIWEPLELSFPETERDALVAGAEKLLDDNDDLEVTATYRLTRKRSREAFRYDQVFRKLVATVPLPQIDALQAKLQSIEAEAFPDATAEPPLGAYKDRVNPREWHDLQRLMADAAESIDSYQSTVDATLAEHFDGFARAIDNQSQLHAAVSHRFRDELVGPDLLSAKLTYELGLGGLRSLERRLEAECGLEASADALAECDGGALARGLAKWSEEVTSHRFAFSLEYERTDELEIERPGLGLLFAADSHRSLILSAAYGRRLGDGATAPRLDFQVAYEDVDEDPLRRDRGTASLVLSHRITEQLTLPLGLLYANHGRYLAGEDEELSAHLGVRYKLQNHEEGR